MAMDGKSSPASLAERPTSSFLLLSCRTFWFRVSPAVSCSNSVCTQC